MVENIKKPNWDESKVQGVAGFYDREKGMPPVNYISKGMKAYANINEIRVDLKILNILENNAAEAEILQICTGSETVEDLRAGDIVFIERQYVDHLDQTDGE